MELNGQGQDDANEKTFVITKSAIGDHLGNVLAKSAGFAVTQQDFKTLVQCFVKQEPGYRSAVGFQLAGDFYKLDSIRENVILANHGSVKLDCIKTEKSICLIIYERPIQFLDGNIVEDNFDSLKLNRDENIFDDFGQMGLKNSLIRGISELGYTRPSLLHKYSIVLAVKKHDMMIQCQTDVIGRATTFLIPIYERIDPNIKACQAIIVTASPANLIEIQRVGKTLSHFMDLKSNFVRVVKGNPQEILRDFSTELLDYKMVVFDAAEKYLHNHNIDQFYTLINALNSDTQIIIFAANVTAALFEFNEIMLKKPVQIIVRGKNLACDGVKHFYWKLVKIEWKVLNLIDIIGKLNKTTQFIIFCNGKETVDLLCDTLTNRNFTVAVVVDNVPWYECQSRLVYFRSGAFQIVLTTNFCCKFKVSPVPLVINFDLPVRKEYFTRIHDIFGLRLTKLVVLNFAAGKEDELALEDIERSCGIKMLDMPPNFVREVES